MSGKTSKVDWLKETQHTVELAMKATVRAWMATTPEAWERAISDADWRVKSAEFREKNTRGKIRKVANRIVAFARKNVEDAKRNSKP